MPYLASWDQTIKVWNLSNTGLTFLSCLSDHESMVYSGNSTIFIQTTMNESIGDNP